MERERVTIQDLDFNCSIYRQYQKPVNGNIYTEEDKTIMPHWAKDYTKE